MAPAVRDIDTIEDLLVVSGQAPATLTAQMAARLGLVDPAARVA